MRTVLLVGLVVLYLSVGNSSLYSKVKSNLRWLIDHSHKNDEDPIQSRSFKNVIEAQPRTPVTTKSNDESVTKKSQNLGGSHLIDGSKHNAMFRLDPILNNLRRTYRKDSDDDSSSDSSSSSLELKAWKDEWKEHWLEKKFEAINSSGTPRGDVVNMLGARPWGVACGDPNQHDMPWGSCMLAMECEPEYRIYRGDYFCGHTRFICCALQLSNYDLNQGFDVSFASTSFETDSAELKYRDENSKEKKRKRKAREKRKRKRARANRKKKIKKNIKKIVKTMKKYLSKMYRNATSGKKKRTRQLKKFVKELKKQYKKDRQSVKDIHELEMVKVDKELMRRLELIRQNNYNFIHNATFRKIVTEGRLSFQGARMLAEAYPDLEAYLPKFRKDGRGLDDPLEYDIEYGMLYYD